MVRSLGVVEYESEVERFLEDLPPSSRYTYKRKAQLDEILQTEYHRLESCRADAETSEYFVYVDISPFSFNQTFLLPDPIAGLRLFYNPELHILITRMSTLEQVQTTSALYTAVAETFRHMGLNHATQWFGGVNVDVGNGKTKQPDGGWSPIRPPPGGARRPGVVVEIGLSEPETKLPNDARMWVDPGKGEANMAITVKINRRKPELKLHTWEWNLNLQGSHVTQSTVITKTGDKVTVSQTPLTIPFHYIFQRSPEHLRETDVQLEKQQLIDWATSVWDVQGI
ncbi:hypothetical protein N7517_000391 [Penicillium concentricum]|uniref:Uncharacterized protein n=1 Tax=Penicillium concentricum TaxID=293559 RepID=A0A9W9VK71_9EURO|nr:uncharacterized protein N7517_000391 [Penicillium concentricum]KAJ5382480.1 hypothetical protein N7517_000391 [Penicillium concentricum]